MIRCCHYAHVCYKCIINNVAGWTDQLQLGDVSIQFACKMTPLQYYYYHVCVCSKPVGNGYADDVTLKCQQSAA